MRIRWPKYNLAFFLLLLFCTSCVLKNGFTGRKYTRGIFYEHTAHLPVPKKNNTPKHSSREISTGKINTSDSLFLLATDTVSSVIYTEDKNSSNHKLFKEQALKHELSQPKKETIKKVIPVPENKIRSKDTKRAGRKALVCFIIALLLGLCGWLIIRAEIYVLVSLFGLLLEIAAVFLFIAAIIWFIFYLNSLTKDKAFEKKIVSPNTPVADTKSQLVSSRKKLYRNFSINIFIIPLWILILAGGDYIFLLAALILLFIVISISSLVTYLKIKKQHAEAMADKKEAKKMRLAFWLSISPFIIACLLFALIFIIG